MDRAAKRAYDAARYQARKPAPRPLPTLDLSDLDAAYLAGLIDGEGCIGISVNHICAQLAIRIQMTDRAVLEWVAARLHTKVRDCKRIKTLPHWKPQYAISVAGLRAAHLCERLLPYLKVKHQQAALGVAFGATLGQYSGPHPIGEQFRAQRLQLKAEMHLLNDDRRSHY